MCFTAEHHSPAASADVLCRGGRDKSASESGDRQKLPQSAKSMQPYHRQLKQSLS